MHGCHIECEPVTEQSLVEAGSPIHDALRAGFVWDVTYGDEEALALPATQFKRAHREAQEAIEGIVLDQDAVLPKDLLKHRLDDDRPSPAKMPQSITPTEVRLKKRRR